MRNTISLSYFNWMIEKTFNSKVTPKHRKVLEYLFDREFTYVADAERMDENRISDGMDLRYRFGDEMNIPQAQIASMLDISPCTVLELIVALALRIEENIMDNPLYGSRTGFWFWNMVDSLGLLDLDDKHFNPDICEDILSKFENRTYKRNGEGSLFTIEREDIDMRDTEIWYQAMIYLEEYSIKTKEA